MIAMDTARAGQESAGAFLATVDTTAVSSCHALQTAPDMECAPMVNASAIQATRETNAHTYRPALADAQDAEPASMAVAFAILALRAATVQPLCHVQPLARHDARVLAEVCAFMGIAHASRAGLGTLATVPSPEQRRG